MNQQKGFVLISTLLLTMLLSFMIVFMLNSGLLSYRMSYGVLQYYQREAALIAGIHAGMVLLNHPQSSRCNATEPAEKWWQQPQACGGSFDQHAYRFIISPLNSDKNCLHYVQINSALLGFEDHVLQVTFLQIDKVGMQQQRCDITPKERVLFSNMRTKSTLIRLSWHEVPVI